VKVLIQAVYVLFVVVAGGIAVVSVVTAGRSPWGGLIALVVAAFVVLGAMLVVHQSSISGPAMRAVMALVGRLGLNP
jgi:fatty acid desaturase